MILVFGGTTEGRKTVKELEEAGEKYYYSTKTGEQDVSLRHGIRVDGGMDENGIRDFCAAHGIRLIVDAAHPFAALLHRNVIAAALSLDIPAIRFERLYPPRTDDIIWCDEISSIRQVLRHLPESVGCRVLCTLGVKSIAQIKPLEEDGYQVFYRILPRESSRRLALRQGADAKHLIDYQEGGDEVTLLKRLQPHIILMKESGESGGFTQKVRAAKDMGIRVIAVRRPPTDKHFITVNGEHGLRRMVEKLLPGFYPLHSGLTTGTCATAAAVAAWRMLYGERPRHVPVILPNGETIQVDVCCGDGYAAVTKDAGDDPDVTDGLEIRATVEKSTHFQVKGGTGVGRFTLPGFDYPIGEPAINKAPREMMRRNISDEVCITISIPKGEETARRTFNPRLGIEGGISVIGVSGIVKPFSEEAFVESIRKCMVVAKASGAGRVVINSGAKSEKFVKRMYPSLPPQAFVEYGNYIGATIEIAHELSIPHITLGVMMGKAVKLAAGHLDTHSRRTTMDKGFIKAMVEEAGCGPQLTEAVEHITLAREIWQLLPEPFLSHFCDIVIKKCLSYCQPLLPDGQLTIILISEEGKIYTTGT